MIWTPEQIDIKDYIVIDIETTGFDRVADTMTTVCIYDSSDKSSHSFLEHKYDKLRVISTTEF
jgi:uncharacterized protein YprB with RNaseH-like and TPR domain